MENVYTSNSQNQDLFKFQTKKACRFLVKVLKMSESSPLKQKQVRKKSAFVACTGIYCTKYSRKDAVKFVEDSL